MLAWEVRAVHLEKPGRSESSESATGPAPRTGGGRFLTRAPIAVQALVQAVSDPSCGGVVVFLGTVRNEFLGVPSVAVEYHAYEEMAELELARIVREAEEEHGARHVALQHRLGRLELEEVSVAIAVSAPHRGEAFAACRHVIEALKARVPIWKKEIRSDGARWQSELQGKGS
jgi:molybdopterin synthase catalytic subunit